MWKIYYSEEIKRISKKGYIFGSVNETTTEIIASSIKQANSYN